MIPGNPHPLLMSGGADPLDEYGVIARALRFRSSAGAKLNKSFGAAGNQKSWTLHVWAKRAKIQGAGSAIPNSFLLGSGTGVQNYSYCGFGNNWNAGTDNLQMVFVTGNVEVASLKTTRQMRDVGEYVALTFVADTPNATGADRLRLYVEDVRQTSFTTAVVPSQNLDLPYINTTTAQGIGELVAAAGYTFEGSMAFFCFVDGSALSPTAFGLRNPTTGQWRPKTRSALKALADAGGANSYFLPFDDPTNTTTLCADASTKGNNWTPSNISLTAGATYDSLTDTPTDNFCTLDALDVISSTATSTDGNLSTSSGVSGNLGKRGTMAANAGKWYWEVTPSAGLEWYIGISRVDSTSDGIIGNTVGGQQTGYSYGSPGQKLNGSVVAYGASFTIGDVIGVALNLDAGSLEFFKNGVSQGVAWASGVVGNFLPAFSDGSTGNSASAVFNFGQRPFAYTPPGGFKALNTKNLPMPTNGAVVKPSTAFVTVTDSGANVQTTLANARAGWANYIEIFKRREASEGWRWRFSDDLGYALESNNTNAKIAFPALTGTSYLGEAIKVAAGNGVAMGRLTHVNGVADTVTDGLGNTRKMLMLRNEAGSNWFVYHPDLTAGKLLYLNLQNAETTDATISTVLSNSFVVAAALASGTYRWIAFAEVEGFLKLWKYVGNGNADGPFHNDMLTPNAVWWKDADTGTNNWHTHDIARDPYNQSNSNLIFNLSDAESSQHGVDLNSNGSKVRTSSSGSNLNGTKQVGVSFAAFPFRYSNAR